MQLGTRWALGSPPPARLPAAAARAVGEVEAALTGSDRDTSTWRWTLTWLEGRAVAELDDGTVIRVGADGSVTVANLDDPEDD
ncbi:MAG: hypothetical protein H7248_01810 [Microbacteriaceae bacterium]|nr:hypothetical protein [Microbacteriaceae bacterium]